MNKSIYTLVPDIYELTKDRGVWNEAVARAGILLGQRFSADLGRLRSNSGNEVGPGVEQTLQSSIRNSSNRATLRLSAMGPRCPKALWYSIHHPELGEPLPPWAEVKYSFGHILEALAIQLAKAAGHEVTGEQDELVLDGIVGHRDCVIDGCVVDVKSSSSRGFHKFKSPQFELADDFGYLDQLDGYVVASRDDPLVRVKDKGYILAIDKQLGHMVLYEHRIRESSIRERIKLYKNIAELSTPPRCTCGTIPYGKSGNIILDTKASYSPYKYCCFPLLRTFVYSKGPIDFVKVVKEPKDATEVSRKNKIIL